MNEFFLLLIGVSISIILNLFHAYKFEEQHLIHNMRQVESNLVAEYVRYLAEFIVEKNEPVEQLTRLHLLFDEMKKDQLPVTREEFESRALLYHTLMDLEDFLNCKMNFIQNLDEIRRKLYWAKE